MKKKILFVEDDPLTLIALQKLLHKPLIDIQHATNGMSARDMFADNDFDMLISEVILPGMNGFELARFVSSTSPHTRIILASNVYRGEAYHIWALKECGAKAYIEKPYDLKQLASTIFELLDISETDGPCGPPCSLQDQKENTQPPIHPGEAPTDDIHIEFVEPATISPSVTYALSKHKDQAESMDMPFSPPAPGYNRPPQRKSQQVIDAQITCKLDHFLAELGLK